MGIFDPDGNAAYAAYFRDALVSGVSLSEYSTDNVGQGTCDEMFLTLQYPIGSMKLEGRLKVCYVINIVISPIQFSCIVHSELTRVSYQCYSVVKVT